jgi:predicted Zn-dependent peptidase
MQLFERFEIAPGVRLSICPTRKLKTVLVKVFLTGDLDESATRRAMVPLVLRRGTRRHPDLQALQRRQEELYGASLVADVLKVGEWHALTFRLEAVNGRFLPGGADVVGEALAFLREFALDPAVEGGRLRADYVAQEKENLGRIIDSLLDNKDQYAIERLLRAMCAGEPYRIYEYGDRAAFPAIDAARVTGEWQRAMASFPMEIYVAGDVEAPRMRDRIAESFAVPRSGGYRPRPAPAPAAVREPQRVEDRLAVNQGKLCIGYRSASTYARGDLEGAVLMNGVLGSFSHSKLFQNVREKASLAYDAGSSFDRTKGILIIGCGIAPENYQRALDICLEQVKALAAGDITTPELESTRESLDNHLLMLEDNLSGLMDIDYTWQLSGRAFDLDGYRRRLREASAERIVEAARGLQLDTIYFLRNQGPEEGTPT